MTFKKLALNCCLLLVGALNLSAVQAGGANGGGGHTIESLFKTRSLELSETLRTFNKESQAILGFEPEDLFKALNNKEGFFVLCATDEILGKIKKEDKMARVFNETPGTVYLNCTDYNYDQWKTRLDLSIVENAVFVLHEGMRVMDMAGENNYGYSKNYIEAANNEDKLNFNLLKNIFYQNSKNCYIEFDCREFLFVEDYCKANLYLNGVQVSTKMYSTDIRNFRSQILNKSSKKGVEANADLVALIKKVQCE
jgi:hypothetical protein